MNIGVFDIRFNGKSYGDLFNGTVEQAITEAKTRLGFSLTNTQQTVNILYQTGGVQIPFDSGNEVIIKKVNQ